MPKSKKKKNYSGPIWNRLVGHRFLSVVMWFTNLSKNICLIWGILLTLKYWSYWPDFYVNETLSATVANADFVRLSPPSDRMIVQLKNIKIEYTIACK